MFIRKNYFSIKNGRKVSVTTVGLQTKMKPAAATADQNADPVNLPA
jgi:hypothetical protein